MRAILRPAARQDILRQYTWYLEQDVPAVADRFLLAVSQSIGVLVDFPEAGVPRQMSNPQLAGLRAWPVKGFEEIRVYYIVRTDQVEVIRILHGRRDINALLEQPDAGG